MFFGINYYVYISGGMVVCGWFFWFRCSYPRILYASVIFYELVIINIDLFFFFCFDLSTDQSWAVALGY